MKEKQKKPSRECRSDSQWSFDVYHNKFERNHTHRHANTHSHTHYGTHAYCIYEYLKQRLDVPLSVQNSRAMMCYGCSAKCLEMHLNLKLFVVTYTYIWNGLEWLSVGCSFFLVKTRYLCELFISQFLVCRLLLNLFQPFVCLSIREQFLFSFDFSCFFFLRPIHLFDLHSLIS